MNSILKMKNRIQPYPWGSQTVIADLLGTDCPSAEPQAELWMGAHPKAPSQVYDQNRWISLPELIRTNPIQVLGKATAVRYHNRLPFLFKVLAAAQPLSIQAHPAKREALCGFARENRLSIALDAPNRNYKDDNHKPEILCALSPFWAVCGFRPIAEILILLDMLGLEELATWVTPLRNQPQAPCLKEFFKALLTISERQKAAVIQATLEKAQRYTEDRMEFQWVLTLGRYYPQDIGILAPILFNLICLQPGQAIYLNAGVAHAYLKGAGMELMANSDNVLRGGLTGKHMDVDELLKIMSFEPTPVQLIEPVSHTAGEGIYPCPAEEFELSRIRVQEGTAYASSLPRGVEILICTQGAVNLIAKETSSRLVLGKGESILVPACHPGYRLEGQGIIFKASGPRG